MESKVNFKTLIGIFAGIIFVIVLQQYLLPLILKPSFDSQLTQLANDINKNLPMIVDAETRWDNTGVLPGKTVLYNYTLINYNKVDIDTIVFRSNMEPQIKNMVKTNPQLKVFRDNDVTFMYNYKDKVGVHITQFIFYPKDYK